MLDKRDQPDTGVSVGTGETLSGGVAGEIQSLNLADLSKDMADFWDHADRCLSGNLSDDRPFGGGHPIAT